MYSTTDFGNICVWAVIICLLFAFLGAPGMLQAIGGLMFLVFVAAMLYK
jgi:hypothetical protein